LRKSVQIIFQDGGIYPCLFRKHCIRGMRIRVKDVLDMLAARVPEEEILGDFPYLEAADIDASLQYAAAQSDHAILAGTVTAACFQI